MGRVRRRQRGEGNAEYVILLLFVLICAVVGLFSSYSGSLKKIQLEKGLCLDCTEARQDRHRQGQAGGRGQGRPGRRLVRPRERERLERRGRDPARDAGLDHAVVERVPGLHLVVVLVD